RHGRALPRRVSRRHCVEGRIALRVILLVVEEHDRERLRGVGIVKHDQLLRRDVVGPVALLHLLAHLRHPLAVDAVERNNTCKCHLSLLVVEWEAYAHAACRRTVLTERRRSRTYRAVGYTTAPGLKVVEVLKPPGLSKPFEG